MVDGDKHRNTGSYNSEWIVEQLNQFIVLTECTGKGDPEDTYGVWWETYGNDTEIKALIPVIEIIFDRFEPGWRIPLPEKTINIFGVQNEKPWHSQRDLAIRTKTLVEREQEIVDNLGDDSPIISASQLHPWVWSGAKSLWQSGHFRSAVEDALKKVNAETQNKLNRRDLSETKLFQEAFSSNAPTPGKPRLRRMEPDESNTFESMQRGARMLAEGIYAGIRNPLNHDDPHDINEQVALEYLAALSVLARWVDEATLYSLN